VRITFLAAILELLFPPKLWNNGIASQSIGHVFVFSDPMSGVNQMAGGFATTSIAWGQLMLQIGITMGLAYVISKIIGSRDS
jgi:hypothetical protein